MSSTCVSTESDTSVTLDVVKAAVSEGPSGIVLGFQLPAWFQSPEIGLTLHIAVPPKATPMRDDVEKTRNEISKRAVLTVSST